VEERSFRRVLAGQDAEQRLPLGRRVALVDNCLKRAVSSCSGPGKSTVSEFEAIKPEITEMPLFNVHPDLRCFAHGGSHRILHT